MNSVTYKQLLRGNLNFRRLWIGQLISELGTWFSFIAELGTVGMLSGSPLATMALLVSRLLPVLFIAPFAGVVVDRASRKKVLIAMDLARAIIALGFLTAGVGGPLWFIILCSGMMSASTTFFEAAKNASIANMVTRDEMLTANILMFSTRFLQLTLGAALGGVTAARFGYKAAFIINSLSFIASAVFIWLIPDPVMRRREQPAAEIETGAESMASPSSGPSSGNRFLIEVREGLTYIWATPFVRAVIIVNVTWALGGGMNNLIFDRLSRHQFVTGAADRGDWNMAVLTTAAGLGLFIGMMLARRAGMWAANERRAAHFIGWSLLVHGLIFAASVFTHSLIMVAVCVAVSRLILGAEFGLQETLVMRVVPDLYRGRVFTTDRALELSTMALSMLIAGPMLTRVSPMLMMVVSGLLSASPGAWWLISMRLKTFSVPSHAIRDPDPVAT